MMRSALLLVVALLGGADRLAAQDAVEMRGITASIKLEEESAIGGRLTPQTVFLVRLRS